MKTKLFILLFFAVNIVFAACGADEAKALTYFAQGKKAYIKKDLKKAEEHFLQSLKYNNDLNNARLMLAKIYYYNRAFNKTLEQLHIILKKEPHHPGALYWQARTLLMTPHIKKDTEDRAIESLQKILDYYDNHLEARLLLALLYEKRNNIKQAVYEYKKIQSHENIFLENRTNLAFLYKKIGLHDKALKEIEVALAIAKMTGEPTKNLEKIKNKLSEQIK